MKKLLFILSLILITFSNLNSQISNKEINRIFPSDSLKGFNEVFYNQKALNEGFFGSEYKVFMYFAKRNFINTKYNIQDTYLNSPLGQKPGTPTTLAAPCVNEDFEAGTFAGWTVSQGQNINSGGSCTMAGCCPAASTNTWIRTTPYAGPLPLGTIPASPFGGTRIAQLNDMVWNSGEIVRIQQTFPVTATNALFQFAYMAAMDGSGHLCCDQPFMKITLLNCLNQPLACPSVSITPPGGSCVSSVPTGWITNTSGVSYTTTWQIKSLDLTPYIGSCVTIQVTVGDCTGWAHAGMAYFDAQCSPMNIQVNNNVFPAGSNIVYASGCGTNTAVMTAPPGLGPYTWNGPAGSGITNNPNQTITTTMGGNYTLTMNPAGACAPITKTVNLSFGTVPNAGFTTVNSCNNYTITNTGTAAPAIQTYSFIGTGAPASYTTTNNTSNIIFPSAGTYTINQTITNTGGCTATVSSVVNIPANPVLNVTNYSICPNGSVTLNVTGANTYTWSPAASLNNPNLQSPTATPASTTIYTVSGTSANGCVGTNTLSVVTNTIPIITTTNTTFCQNNSGVLTANGGVTYTWTPSTNINNVNISNPTVNPLTTTTYTVSSIGTNGCVGTAIAIANVNPLPVVTVNNPTVCTGNTINLTANGGVTYTWTGPNSFSSNTQNPSITNANTNYNGQYTVTVTDVNGCINSNSSNVNVAPPFSITANNSSPICEGKNLTLTSPSGYTYNWSGPNGFASNAQNPSIINITPNYNGTYTLIVTDANGCQGSNTTNVLVNSNPKVSIISGKDKLCAPACVDFTLTSTVPPSSISWEFLNGVPVNNTVTTQCYNKGGIYTSTATITDINGCQGSITSTIEIYNTPTADFIYTPLRPIEGDEIYFTNASFGSNNLTYNWYFVNSLDSNFISNPTHIFDTQGSYPITLVVTNDKGCSDTITKVINVGIDFHIYVPNTFTPNGDGWNDIFQPKGTGITKYKLYIFDRWGEQIFDTDNFNQGWDGTIHRGKDVNYEICKNDVYVWLIQCTDVFGKSHELKGHVTLMK